MISWIEGWSRRRLQGDYERFFITVKDWQLCNDVWSRLEFTDSWSHSDHWVITIPYRSIFLMIYVSWAIFIQASRMRQIKVSSPIGLHMKLDAFNYFETISHDFDVFFPWQPRTQHIRKSHQWNASHTRLLKLRSS